MKFKELKRILALSLAFTMLTPSGVFASELEGMETPQTEQDIEAAPQESEVLPEERAEQEIPDTEENPQTPENEEPIPEEPIQEIPEQETPEAYEARTGYVLPEGHHYVLEEGFVTFQEDGTPKIEADVQEPAEPEQETPEEYEARTGYVLPEGHHYVLEEGFVTFQEDGTPKIEADVQEPAEPEQETPEEYEARTGYVLPEGHHYVLEEGFVTFQEDGTPKIEADAQEPAAPVQETPEEYEARTGYVLPEGHHYVLEEGFVTFQEDGTPRIEADAPVRETPEEYEARTGYVLPEGHHYVLEDGFVLLDEYDMPQLEAEDASAPKTNEQLIASQQIIRLPVIVEDFRFWTVARKYAFAKDTLEIKEEMTAEARSVGRLAQNGVCYILKEEDGWLYVESGTVRGFVQADAVVTGEQAQSILEEYQKKAKEQAASLNQEYTGIEGTAPVAEELVPRTENQAFLYLRATVNQTVVKKEYAICRASLLNIREGKGTDSRIVGTLSNGSVCYILADKDQDWVYIESGDVRGFVSRNYIEYSENIQTEITQNGEDNYGKAAELVSAKDNQACYYTLTSVKSGVPGGELRSSVLEFASQFIGNPYVWGGTSLTDGADCSGFVQSIFKEYGYDLPRVAEDQAQYGVKIPVEDAQPGDLIFYAKDGYIHHVVLYAGDGKTIEAKGTNYGIVQADLNTNSAVWATRILNDSTYGYGSADIAEVNATEDMYGEDLGDFQLTYYCACEVCCDVETGITATGTPVIQGQTIAVDPTVIPYGTQVIINGHIFTAEDCGGAIKGNHIDIYVNDHETATALGVNYANVHLLK